MQWLRKSLLLILGLSFLYSCGTTKKLTTLTDSVHSSAPQHSRAELVQRLQAPDRQWQAIKATTEAEISLKGKNFSSKVNITAIKGEGFELSVTPFPLIRVARVWINTSGITIVDLINKRYTIADYPTLSQALGFDLNYEQLEALLTGEVFVPGSSSPKDLGQLAYSYFKDGKMELKGSQKKYNYHFDLDSTARLRSFVVEKSDHQPLVTTTYVGEQGPLPASVVITPKKVEIEGQSYFSLDWQKLSFIDPHSVDLKPVIKESYEPIDISRLLEMLGR